MDEDEEPLLIDEDCVLLPPRSSVSMAPLIEEAAATWTVIKRKANFILVFLLLKSNICEHMFYAINICLARRIFFKRSSYGTVEQWYKYSIFPSTFILIKRRGRKRDREGDREINHHRISWYNLFPRANKIVKEIRKLTNKWARWVCFQILTSHDLTAKIGLLWRCIIVISVPRAYVWLFYIAFVTKKGVRSANRWNQTLCSVHAHALHCIWVILIGGI